MDSKLLSDYRKKATFQRSIGKDVISLDIFLQLLSKAEEVNEENQWLYGKLE